MVRFNFPVSRTGIAISRIIVRAFVTECAKVPISLVIMP